MASSSNQKLANELIEAADDFEGMELSLSSVEQFCAHVKDVARRLGAPTPIGRHARGSRRLLAAVENTPMAEPRGSRR